MTIGGLTVGVTPLDMAHAYETIAHGGRRVSGTLAEENAPVGIQEVEAGAQPLPDGAHRDVNQVKLKPVLPAGVAATETSMLETVLQYGTARAAALGQFAAGKTGTTTNYGDAWFIGWDSRYTVAVWVGYPNGLVPMTTEFNGGPVLGGTFPALIWHGFMTSAMQIDKGRAEQASVTNPTTGKPSGLSTPSASEATTPSSPPATPRSARLPAGAGKADGNSPTQSGLGNGAGGGSATQGSERASAPSTPPADQSPISPPPAGRSPSTPSPAPSTPPAASSPSRTGGVSPAG
jgi:penicillin-binding protein 1A